jgi:hypothetical protein
MRAPAARDERVRYVKVNPGQIQSCTIGAFVHTLRDDAMARKMHWQVDWVGAVAFICGVAVIVPSLFVLVATLLAIVQMIS